MDVLRSAFIVTGIRVVEPSASMILVLGVGDFSSKSGPRAHDVAAFRKQESGREGA